MKKQLREDILNHRREFTRSLSPSLREELEEKLAEIVLPRLVTARIVAGYHPMKDEISPYPLLNRLVEQQISALPWFVDRDSKMIFRAGPATEIGPWGVLQPSANAKIVQPDVVLVPLVTADRRGTRIGRGKGHYDRALSHLKETGHVTAIGIAYEFQISSGVIPADPWDISLDALATPAEWIECR